MKKFIFPIALLFLISPLFSQEEKFDVTVTNVEVPVRVLDGNRFVDNLTRQDFEVYEDGKLQKIEALYLVQKTKIERKETLKVFFPSLSRNFYLLFHISDYNPKFAEAIDYLFNHVLLPEDSLTIITPLRAYSLSKQAMRSKLKESLSKEMQGIIRKDTKIGSSNYRSLLRDLKRLVRGISIAGGFGHQSGIMSDFETDQSSQNVSLELLLPRYKSALQRMENLRFIDEKKFIKFAEGLKRQKGQKNVFFFYEREFRPEISPSVLNQMMTLFQDQPHIQGDLADLFGFYHRPITFDFKKLKQAFADSSLVFNFIFMNKKPETISGIYMKEQSEDVFTILSEAAKITGGVVDNSQDPASGFKKAVENSESYYLLYYSPIDYKQDGKFKNLEVKVKNKIYTIAYRHGYYAK